MKRWGRFGIILLAYGITLLHTAVPHHHDSSTDRTIVTRAGCHFNHAAGGLLQMVFSTDLGYGHLEIFNNNADAKVGVAVTNVFLPAVFLPPASLSLESSEAHVPSTSGFAEKLHQRLLLLSTAQFRAPPVRLMFS